MEIFRNPIDIRVIMFESNHRLLGGENWGSAENEGKGEKGIKNDS